MTLHHRLGILLSATALLGCRPPAPAAQSTDARTPLPLPAPATDAVRAEMRTMLGSLHTILAAPHDTAAVRRAAHAAGMAGAADTALEHLLPEPFLQLGMATHQQFDTLAGAVARGLPQDSLLAHLGRITSNCVSCHATYRLAPPAPGAAH
jgi:hypothetical protein